MVQRGVRDANRGTSYVGPALDWSQLNYARRVEEMREETLEGLKGGTSVRTTGNQAIREIMRKKVLFVTNAVPDSMSVAAAREMVGQPHLADHSLHGALAKVDGGPIHLVACHKGVTGSQARTMLGFPDVTVVSPPFGVYVVDPIQSIQLVLLAQCRDATNTKLGVQRFLEWLDKSEQSAALIQHAAKRKQVVKADHHFRKAAQAKILRPAAPKNSAGVKEETVLMPGARETSPVFLAGWSFVVLMSMSLDFEVHGMLPPSS